MDMIEPKNKVTNNKHRTKEETHSADQANHKMPKTRDLVQLITTNLFKADLFKADLFQPEWIKLPKTKLVDVLKHLAKNLAKNFVVNLTKNRTTFWAPIKTTAPVRSGNIKENHITKQPQHNTRNPKKAPGHRDNIGIEHRPANFQAKTADLPLRPPKTRLQKQ